MTTQHQTKLQKANQRFIRKVYVTLVVVATLGLSAIFGPGALIFIPAIGIAAWATVIGEL